MKKITKLFLSSLAIIPVISVIPISIISCSRNNSSDDAIINSNYSQLLKQSRVTITKNLTFDNLDTLSTNAILTSKISFKYSIVYTWYVSSVKITINNDNQITSKYLQAITTSTNYINLNQFTDLISGKQYYFAVSAFAFHQKVNNSDQTIYKTNPIWSIMKNSITYINNTATTNDDWVNLWYASKQKSKMVTNAFNNFIRNNFLETIFNTSSYKWNTQYSISYFNELLHNKTLIYETGVNSSNENNLSPFDNLSPLNIYYCEFKLLNTQVTNIKNYPNEYDLDVSFIYTLGTAQTYSQSSAGNINIGNFIPVDNIIIKTFKYEYNNIEIKPTNPNNINKLEFITNSNSNIQYTSYFNSSSNTNTSTSSSSSTNNSSNTPSKIKQIIYSTLTNPTNNILWTLDNVTNNS